MNPGTTQRRCRFAVLLAATLAASCGKFDSCGNDVLARVPSPTGSRQAIVFERDCGATTGFSTQISIVGRDEVVREQPSTWAATESGNVLVIDADHGAATAGP